MTPNEKLNEIRSIIMTHIGDRDSLEKKILKVINQKQGKKVIVK